MAVITFAYHEAGHAVAACVLNSAFKKVTIEWDPEQGVSPGVEHEDWPANFCSPEGDWPPDSCPPIKEEDYKAAFQYWWGRIIVYFAGGEAEDATIRKIAPPETKTDDNWGWDAPCDQGSEKDRANICDLIQKLEQTPFTQMKDLPATAVFCRARDEAFDLIREPKNLNAVRALAKALMREKTLSGCEAVKIIRNAQEGSQVT